jgi:hypothetical protein
MLKTPNGYRVNMNSVVEATEVFYEFKIRSEVGTIDEKLSSIKMKEYQVVDVCKITTKVEDFDEAMPVVQA